MGQALALVAGLWGISTWYRLEQLEAATEVDMALLTDDLPPSAYADPGFEEYLRSNEGADAAILESEEAAPEVAPETEVAHETT